MSRRRNTCGAVIAAGLLLAGCEGRVTVDLVTEAPADPEVVQVLTGLRGLQFRTSGSGTESIEFTDSELVDLMDYLSGTPFRLFTDEELPEATYTGVRLIFDDEEDNRVIRTDGGEVPVILVEGSAFGTSLVYALRFLPEGDYNERRSQFLRAAPLEP